MTHCVWLLCKFIVNFVHFVGSVGRQRQSLWPPTGFFHYVMALTRVMMNNHHQWWPNKNGKKQKWLTTWHDLVTSGCWLDVIITFLNITTIVNIPKSQQPWSTQCKMVLKVRFVANLSHADALGCRLTRPTIPNHWYLTRWNTWSVSVWQAGD